MRNSGYAPPDDVPAAECAKRRTNLNSNGRSVIIGPGLRCVVVKAATLLGMDAAKVDRNLPTKSRWLKRPCGLARETCLFVTVATGGCVPEHALVHARAWQASGMSVILIVASDHLAAIKEDDLQFADGILLRENRGYDFGAWADAIRQLGKSIASLDLLVIANDSVFGPFFGLDGVLADVRAVDGDVVGLTESHERTHHFQSFVLFFKSRALRSEAFRLFWRSVRQGDREWVIGCYEIRLRDRLSAAGLSTAVLYDTNQTDHRNPTLGRWRELVDRGFPYVKISLLRDNAYNVDLRGWDEAVRTTGYDISIIERYFDRRSLRIALGDQA
ncbi:rhamnan synthesis F family protein [Sphingomonas bacterium]|uniref:rhamnan synthesis F family protein n=1 Tax=Sphingomonas bacterium TaxID=1895847 RepID=UPI001575540C|nr:rhamnan synthesis F family protein [Sphingomonas bacterium]